MYIRPSTSTLHAPERLLHRERRLVEHAIELILEVEHRRRRADEQLRVAHRVLALVLPPEYAEDFLTHGAVVALEFPGHDVVVNEAISTKRQKHAYVFVPV